MTRTLFVLRHGKSDWGAPSGGDHERPLKPRGEKAARRMGRLLTSAEVPPDLVLASSAIRARSTAEIAYEAGAWTCPVEISRDLYESTPTSILSRLQALGPEVERVLVVGHEPTCSELVGTLSASQPPRFPTGALARIDFELASWDHVAPGLGELVWLIPPRALD